MDLNEQSKKRAREQDDDWEDVEEQEKKPRKIVKAQRKVIQSGLQQTGDQNSDMECEDS